MIKRLLVALLLGAAAVLALIVPFFGAFTVGLVLAIICALSGTLLAPYCRNSEYVEFGFAWITVHSSHVYFVYWALFSTIMFIGLTLVSFARRTQNKEREE
jgi:uncharacterized membrane protein